MELKRYYKVRTLPIERQIKKNYTSNKELIVIDSNIYPDYYQVMVDGKPYSFLFKKDCEIIKHIR